MVASNAFDYYYQTLENVRFFSIKDADVCIVTVKEPLGIYKAVVMRAEGKHRTALMSGMGNNITEALQILHHKSAEAVYNHMDTYGCDFVRNSKKRSGKARAAEDDDSASDSSEGSDTSEVVLSEVCHDGSSSDDDNAHTDGSDDEKTTKPRHRRARKRESNPFVPRSRSVSPTGGFTLADIPPPRANTGVRPTAGRPPPTSYPAHGPPGPGFQWSPWGYPTPPDSYGGGPSYPGVVGARYPSGPTATAAAGPSATPNTTAAHPQSPAEQTGLRDVRLHITWSGHGDVRTLEKVRPSRRAVEAAAARFASLRSASFGVVPNGYPVSALRASVRATQLSSSSNSSSSPDRSGAGKEVYDMAAYAGDDLSRIFGACDGGIPLFEVLVEKAPGVAPPRWPRPPAAVPGPFSAPSLLPHPPPPPPPGSASAASGGSVNKAYESYVPPGWNSWLHGGGGVPQSEPEAKKEKKGSSLLHDQL